MAEEKPAQKNEKNEAQLIVLPNHLKEKVGSGGFDEAVVTKAQDKIKNNTVDFRPIAAELITQMDKAIADARSGVTKGMAAVRGIMAPAMQLKAQGSLFHYPLVSEISDILVNFLETAASTDADALDIVTAHKTSLNVALSGRIREKDRIKVGNELCKALYDSCDRYYKMRKNQ